MSLRLPPPPVTLTQRSREPTVTSQSGEPRLFVSAIVFTRWSALPTVSSQHSRVRIIASLSDKEAISGLTRLSLKGKQPDFHVGFFQALATTNQKRLNVGLCNFPETVTEKEKSYTKALQILSLKKPLEGDKNPGMDSLHAILHPGLAVTMEKVRQIVFNET